MSLLASHFRPARRSTSRGHLASAEDSKLCDGHTRLVPPTKRSDKVTLSGPLLTRTHHLAAPTVWRDDGARRMHRPTRRRAACSREDDSGHGESDCRRPSGTAAAVRRFLAACDVIVAYRFGNDVGLMTPMDEARITLTIEANRSRSITHHIGSQRTRDFQLALSAAGAR